MEIDRAKELLNAYQVEHEIPPNSELFEAMELLKVDQELADWYERQQEFDAKLKGAFSQLPEIPDVRDKCLEQVSTAESSSAKSFLFRILAIFTMLVLFTLVGGISYVWYCNGKVKHMVDFRDAMTYYTNAAYFMLEHTEPDFEKVSNCLSEKNGPVFDRLPFILATQAPFGCKTLNWQGQTVSLVSFRQKNGEILYLFIVAINPNHKHFSESFNELVVENGLESFGWFNNGKVYLLTASEPSLSIARYHKAVTSGSEVATFTIDN